jgi:hypothetical protein
LLYLVFMIDAPRLAVMLIESHYHQLAASTRLA